MNGSTHSCRGPEWWGACNTAGRLWDTHIRYHVNCICNQYHCGHMCGCIVKAKSIQIKLSGLAKYYHNNAYKCTYCRWRLIYTKGLYICWQLETYETWKEKKLFEKQIAQYIGQSIYVSPSCPSLPSTVPTASSTATPGASGELTTIMGGGWVGESTTIRSSVGCMGWGGHDGGE